MKKSINAWTFPPEYTFTEVLEAAKTAGFDAVEFNLDAIGVSSKHAFTLESDESLIAEVSEKARELGIKLVSVSSSLHNGIWSKTDEKTAQYREAVLKKQLSIAKILGADAILLVPGGMSDGMLLDEARKNSLISLKKMIPMIKESGVTVGLENVWNGFFLSPYDMVSFLKELDSDAFALYFDLGNMVAFSNSEYWCDIVAPYITKIHIKDYKRNGGINSGGKFCQLLEGDLDFKTAMAVLKKHGFDGYMTAEVGKSDPEMSYRDYFKSISDAEDIISKYYDEA
jgi:hexulose-6-phosphate isomerase